MKLASTILRTIGIFFMVVGILSMIIWRNSIRDVGELLLPFLVIVIGLVSWLTGIIFQLINKKLHKDKK